MDGWPADPAAAAAVEDDLLLLLLPAAAAAADSDTEIASQALLADAGDCTEAAGAAVRRCLLILVAAARMVPETVCGCQTQAAGKAGAVLCMRLTWQVADNTAAEAAAAGWVLCCRAGAGAGGPMGESH